jgi:uncharacterized membrane protein YqjE
MRPLAVLIGIVMGSTVSIFAGLALTGVVVLLVPDDADRLVAERAPLVKAIVLFALAAAAAGWSFYGEIRQRRWRFPAHAVLVTMLGATVWMYWPR